jgi:hypothetical protein
LNPSDIFGLIVRICGFGAILLGLADVFHVAAALLPLGMPSQYSIGTDLAAAAFYLLVGCAILLGADHVVRLAYARREGR